MTTPSHLATERSGFGRSNRQIFRTNNTREIVMVETPASFPTSADGRFWHISLTKTLWKTMAGKCSGTIAWPGTI